MHARLYPAGFYYTSSVWEQDHTEVERVISYVSISAEDGPAMAGPAGPVPASMISQQSILFHYYHLCLVEFFSVVCFQEWIALFGK